MKLVESTLTDKACRRVGAYHGMVDYLYGRASAVIRSGLQLYRHWRRYDFLVCRNKNIIILILFFLNAWLILTQQVLWLRLFNPLLTEALHLLKGFSLL